MSSPYDRWPLWHNFTLHFQNLSGLGDRLSSFRAINKSSLISENTVAQELSERIVVYDFMNDNITRLSQFPDAYLLLVTERGNIDDMVKNGIITEDTYIVMKSPPPKTGGNGGDMSPLIGKPKYITLAIDYILNNKDCSRDFRTLLPESERKNIDALLDRVVYKAPGIVKIFDSRKTCTTVVTTSPTAEKETNLIRSISNFVTNTIKGNNPNNVALNMLSGKASTNKNDVIIQEYSVKSGNNPPVNVRFSFPSSTTESQMKDYIRILEKNFSAKRVHSPSQEQRKATSLKPVQIRGSSISSIFSEPEKFHEYIAMTNEANKESVIDMSSLPSSLPSLSQEEEEIEEEDDDLSNH